MAHRTWLTICRAVRSGANNFSMMAVSLMGQYNPIRNQKPPISPRRLLVAAGSWAFAGALARAGTGSGRSANEIGSGPLKVCPATHLLPGRELRALPRLEREATGSPFVFVSERGAPFSTRGFQAMVERVAQAAGFDMKIHPHMLRHACGYKLANERVDTRTMQGYLGHKSIQHTVRYTPETGNGSFQRQPWNHCAPISRRQIQMIAWLARRCSESSDQFLKAIHVLAMSKAK